MKRTSIAPLLQAHLSLLYHFLGRLEGMLPSLNLFDSLLFVSFCALVGRLFPISSREKGSFAFAGRAQGLQ